MPVTPLVLDQKAANKLNLQVLKRIDPATEDVLATAGHVALYDFNQESSCWERKDVEGSLFLLKRRTNPRFQFIILNKKSQDNYVEDVLGGFQFEKSKPYLLYRNKKDEVVGIWFYDQGECDKVEALLQRIVATFPPSAAAPVPAPAPAADPKTPGHGEDSFWDRDAPPPPSGMDPLAARLQAPNLAHGRAVPPPAAPAPPMALNGNAASAASGLEEPSLGATPVRIGGRAPATSGAAGHGMAAEPAPTPEQSRLTMLLSNAQRSAAAASPAPAAPPPARPQLLTPSFFQQAAQAAAGMPGALGTPSVDASRTTSTEAAPPGARGDSDAVARLFARAGSSTLATPPAALAIPSTAAPAGGAGAPGPPAQAPRERVRAAIVALAQSNAFVDMVAQELQRTGLLR
ncbi:hypothetical protein WJX81_007923 [Elliptochloris bilobata]|uniref:mRNA-decapping enzyme-like protein n=1 Tax=Elliptochloris bilobata TaxID=381761 RepID=A0AAW1S4Z8_9CHLO